MYVDIIHPTFLHLLGFLMLSTVPAPLTQRSIWFIDQNETNNLKWYSVKIYIIHHQESAIPDLDQSQPSPTPLNAAVR